MSLLRPIVGFSKVGLLETAEVADNWSISDIPVLITVQSEKIYNQMTSSVFFYDDKLFQWGFKFSVVLWGTGCFSMMTSDRLNKIALYIQLTPCWFVSAIIRHITEP